MLRTVEITRYITPLREGSSLPALVEADDGAEPGPLHAGVTDDPAATFQRLYEILVDR